MRYELKRNSKGMVTQCDTNADGGNIYAQREEINKLALENLQRSTPGKLGNLSNLQVFNFQIGSFDSGTGSDVGKTYNQTNAFPANCTQTIMFGVDGLNNKALYYNIVGINARLNAFITGGNFNPSFVSFYLLQNIETSTSSLGTKIPQPAPLYGNGGGAVTYTTDGDNFGHQSISIDLYSDAGYYAQNNDTKGLRASGLALRDIFLNFNSPIDRSLITIDVSVLVDTTSVSTTY